MPYKRTRKGKFKHNFEGKPTHQESKLESENKSFSKMEHTNTVPKIFQILLYFIGPLLAAIFWNRGLSMFSSMPPKIVFAVVLFGVCVYISLGVWIFTGWASKCPLFKNAWRRIACMAFVVLIVVVSPITYTLINYLIKDLGSIEMEEFGDASTPTIVRFGQKSNEVVLAKTTIGDLQVHPMEALQVNGQDILSIHTEQGKLYVDALLFGGYKKPAFANLSLARTKEFTIAISAYFNTNIAGTITKETLDGYIADNVTVTKIAQAILNSPLDYRNNKISLPPGWKKDVRSNAISIRNENNIPVFVLEYKNPYQITVSGIFISPFGILKIDNNDEAIFKFSSNIIALGTYKVNNIFVHSFIDLFVQEKQYDLYQNYSNQGIINTMLTAVEKALSIPSHEVRNLVIKPTAFPATLTTPNGLLIEFSKRWDDVDPISISISISISVTGIRIDQQYAWWAPPNLTGFNINQIVSFRKGVLKDAFSGSSNIAPPLYTYYSLGKPLSSNNSLYLWFVSPNPITIESIVFQGVHFHRMGNSLVQDRR